MATEPLVTIALSEYNELIKSREVFLDERKKNYEQFKFSIPGNLTSREHSLIKMFDKLYNGD